ncbi:hypothetical protein [Flavobacterium difficile]|uniref:TonB C-terminal domain-containing protein n=1 Tax=Flavobacterium difficile TaxID=2709659 RepID=A0ABX0I4D8_9FLAO|nr:hypothetical protein [Flavobacterium difficile]NHM01442.1 hypothetical protein [Flavobacterium difficile]
MRVKIFKLFLFLFSFSVWSQKNDSLVDLIKNEDLKIDFQEYLKEEQKVLMFFQTKANPNKDGSIEITNEENSAYYDQAVSEYKAFEKAKRLIYRNYYDKIYQEDKVHIYKRFNFVNKKINEFYISRFKLLKTNISNALKPEKADVLPVDICQRLTESKELLQPTHDTCKKLGLSITDETTCFANYLRNNVAQHIQKYIGESDESANISTAIQFVIDNEGNLVFDKFTRSCGILEYDLMVYRGFKSFAASTVFCPAKYNDKNVAIYYNLPVRMVFGGY